MLAAVRRLGRLFGLGSRHPKPPTTSVFHVTHYKAGSQWVHRILHALAYDRLVSPVPDRSQFFRQPILPGKVYPTVYATKQEFDTVALPRRWRRFVVIRDIRDTLVSAYFSFKNSHERVQRSIDVRRAALNSLNTEDGLLYLIDTWLPTIAQMQWSWLAAGEELIRYEDLLERDEEILERVLLGHCRLEVTPEKLREVVRANRFEARTGGRKPGEEDVNCHERKGIAGDWKNHFTARIFEAIVPRYSSLLVATGYERNLNWHSQGK
jgi:lipopolysaccharide transport system ATP-binding protein